MGDLLFKPMFTLKEGIQGEGVFTTVTVPKGETLFEMSGEILDHPTRTSIQVGKNKHIEDDIGIHINHSCAPNAKINRRKRTFISLRTIEAGEEITFDYNQNEDLMASPFICRCCNKMIRGKLAAKMEV
jgi:hypothetical protein